MCIKYIINKEAKEEDLTIVAFVERAVDPIGIQTFYGYGTLAMYIS